MLSQHAEWSRCFAREPRYFHAASSHFIDRRYGMARRIQAMATDLESAAQVLGPVHSAQIASGSRLRLWSVHDDLHLELGLNDCSYHEGLWAISLRDNAAQRLYYASMHFCDRFSLLIPTLQGPTGVSSEEGRCIIRSLTKTCEGMRPPALLVAALRAMANTWGITHLAGINPEYHVKGRWNLRESRLQFDYAGLWKEQAGSATPQGHWVLPVALASRAPEDAPSNKRAMYRRRQSMLDSMERDIQHRLTAA